MSLPHVEHVVPFGSGLVMTFIVMAFIATGPPVEFAARKNVFSAPALSTSA
jgi:hypothetical protein